MNINVPGRTDWVYAAGTYPQQTFIEENKEKKKGYSIRHHTMDLLELERKKVPGPGHYDIKLTTKSKSPEYRYGSEKRFRSFDAMAYSDTPGPGVHKADPNFGFRTTQSFKFGNSQRKSLYEFERTPGPGNYESAKLKVLQTAPRFSVGKEPTGAKYLMSTAMKNPAPGKYDPNFKLVHEAARTTFTPTEKRPDFEKFGKTPGPGHYLNPKADSGPTWKYAIVWIQNGNRSEDTLYAQHFTEGTNPRIRSLRDLSDDPESSIVHARQS